MPPAPTEQMPFAPLVERCIDLEVNIEPSEFHDEASSFLASIGEILNLTTHKNVEQWIVKIEKPKNGPPKPKATLFSIPQVCRDEVSTREGASIESFHFLPPTEQGAAKLRYSQCKPKSGTIMPFTEARSRFVKIIDRWESVFGAEKLGELTMSYWNDLNLLTGGHFHSPGLFHRVPALCFFWQNCVSLGTLMPPWNTTLNWEIPDTGGSQSRLEIRADGKGPIWTIISYGGKRSPANKSTSECANELDIAHDSLYEMFNSHFTPEALEFCRNGKVSSNPPKEPKARSD